MQVEFRDEGERLTVRPQGRMEAADGLQFASSVMERLQPATRSVIIDLDQLDFISLGGVRAILQLARSLKATQRKLDFTGGNHAVREALHQTGLNSFFAFTPAL